MVVTCDGTVEALIAEQVGVSVYWNALKESYAFELRVSRVQTEIRYDPGARPALFHLNVALEE